MELKFEYGVENQVILMSSNFKPFKPDPYDIDEGRKLFNLDIIRCCTNFVLNLINIGIQFRHVYDRKKRNNRNLLARFLSGSTEEVLLFVLFMAQLIFLLQRSSSDELLALRNEVINWTSIQRQSKV